MDLIRKYLINAGLLAISLLATIVIAEILLRFTPYKKNSNMSHERYYYMADSLSGYDIADSFPIRSFKIIDQTTTDMEIWTNELGCFDKPYKGEKKTVLLVGDSFTWGHVPFERTWGSVMEGLIDSRILKCGVGGYGTKAEGNKIKKVIAKANVYPELIILGYFVGNDLTDDCTFPNTLIMDGYRVTRKNVDYETGKITDVPESELRTKMNAYLKKQAIKEWIVGHSIIYNLLREITVIRKIAAKFGLTEADEIKSFNRAPLYSVLPERLPWLKNAWQEHLDNLEKIKSIADSYESKLLVVIIPSKEQVYSFLSPSFENADWEYTNKRLADFFSCKKIEYLDLLPLFREYADQTTRKLIDVNKDLYWRYDPHWNIKGNYLAGLLVGKHIIEKGMIDVNDREGRLSEINRELKAFR